jgi:hypothetical protein
MAAGCVLRASELNFTPPSGCKLWIALCSLHRSLCDPKISIPLPLLVTHDARLAGSSGYDYTITMIGQKTFPKMQ